MSISVVKDNPLIVQVGTTVTITDEAHLDVDDTEYSDSAITYVITTAPTKGALLKNGVATSSFTQDDLNNDRISYHETTPSNSSTSDSFFFKASDPGGNQTNNTLFQININPPPPPPDNPVSLSVPGVLTGYAGLAIGFRVQVVDDHLQNENYTVVISAGSGKLSIPAMNGVSSTLTFSGSFAAVNATLATLDYIANGSGHDTITVTVTDQTDQTTATKLIDVAALPQGDFVTLDDPIANQTRAFGINDAGQIAGFYVQALSGQHGFLYSGGSFTTLDDPNHTSEAAQGINDSTVVVGSASPPTSGLSIDLRDGFIYNNGTFQFPGQHSREFFEDINNNGAIAGYFTNIPMTMTHAPPVVGTAFVFQNGSYQTFGPQGDTQAYGINDAGQVVGKFNTVNTSDIAPVFGPQHGFLYDGGIFSTFDAPNASATLARDINNNGDIVGYFQSQSDGGTHGFAYDPAAGQWTTIDVPGAVATFVYGLNDLDQIVGSYTDSSGKIHGFVGDIPRPLPHVAGNVDEWILFNGKWEESAQPGSHPAGARVAAVADFTGEGTSDILWQNVNTGAVDLWKMKHGAWAGSVDLGTHPGSGWQIAGAGDFNRDGTGDVFWFNPGSGQTDIWQLVNGQWAASVSPGSHPLGYQVAGIADFNRDGTSDVLWFNPSTGHVDEWNIVNGHWAGSNSIGAHPGSGWQVAGVGDFNNDGTGDVFWFNPASGATDIWLLQNGMWSASVSPGNHPTGYQVAGIGDFDGDGTSDVLWFNPATGNVDRWDIQNGRWNGSADLGAHPGTGWSIAGVGDFNGSLMSDVLWHQFV
ncbi:MAG: FG-GAP-like repeat-containing protein [Xanthobacteraceae bacterium]